ncbi:MAG: hypothetical protein AAB650_01735, partial [Patescibacteria group bacterium]
MPVNDALGDVTVTIVSAESRQDRAVDSFDSRAQRLGELEKVMKRFTAIANDQYQFIETAIIEVNLRIVGRIVG